MIDASRSTQVRYRLSLPNPETHLVDVEMRIPAGQPMGTAVDLSMAAWSPGSYLIRDYARYLRHLSAESASGQALALHKLDKQTWRIERGEATAEDIVVRYQVYGHDLTVRTNHIDGTHAFLHGPATFLFVDALRSSPCHVDIQGPQGSGWYVATGMEADGDGFLAPNLDALLDRPIHIGECQVRSFEVLSTPVRLVVWGDLDPGGIATLDQLVSDLEIIMETHAQRFGQRMPFDHYTFILMLTPGGYGGLEHENSSANLNTPFALATRKNYEGVLELLSHEFFHVWNGKRMAPASLSRPFDYSREVHTACLWVMEGLTSYYDRLAVLRSRAMTAKRYLEKLAEEWGRLRSTPGRSMQSLQEASFDAWIKLYKPDESNLNTTVSYYLKGGLVALALDLTLRAASRGARSLDNVLALLWREYQSTGAPYPENVQDLFERAAEMELGEFFERHVRGREDPDLNALLGHAGLSLHETWEPPKDNEGRTPVWLGAMVEGAQARVKSVLDRSPAARAGLSPGDEIVAMDGWRVSSESDLRKRLASRSQGATVELALFRRGRLLAVSVELEKSPPSRHEILAPAEPTAQQKAFFAAWLGEAHPGPGTVATASRMPWL
jgi:predicted metalloprotease with PDZ domain